MHNPPPSHSLFGVQYLDQERERDSFNQVRQMHTSALLRRARRTRTRCCTHPLAPLRVCSRLFRVITVGVHPLYDKEGVVARGQDQEGV